MRLSRRKIAAAAFVAFLMSAFNLCAEAAAKPAPRDEKAIGSSASEPAASLPSAPMAAASMATAAPYSKGSNLGTPRAELFLGYSYVRAVPTLADGNRLVWLNGGSTNLAFNFNRYLGVVGDFGAYTNSEIRFKGAYTATVDVNNANVAVFSYLFGPRLSFRNHERVTPFAQALFGGVHANEVALTNCTVNCRLLPTEDTFAMTAGGGLDLKIHRHFAVRIIQAEYLMTRFKSDLTGNAGTQNDMRLSSGIVFRFGGNHGSQTPALPPLAYSCSVNPSTIFVGDTAAASGTALNLDPAKTAVYTWSADGGTVSGMSSAASIDTKNVAPGTYTLKGHVSEDDKPGDNADCTAPYVVKAFEPPTVSCSASPSDIKPGETSTVSATGLSPQSRPLIYNYSAASGTISGSGSAAVFNSAGAPTGSTAITCNVTDDKGQVATANTNVTITAPPPPSAPPAEQMRLETRLTLRSVFFPTAQPRGEHPEGGLVASQRETLTALATDFMSYLTFKPAAHLNLNGHADVRGSVEYNQALSERRVARTKKFLVQHGVPDASIDTHGLGEDQELNADEVKDLVEQNPDLNAVERAKILRDLTLIVLAQNRRVDVSLSTTGQQSVRLYPFNATDAMTLLDKRSLTPGKRAANPSK